MDKEYKDRLKKSRAEVIKFHNKASIDVQLTPFCGFAKKDDYMEITEWTNGEGYDIIVEHENDKMSTQFRFTYGEWLALKAAMKVLLKQDGEVNPITK